MEHGRLLYNPDCQMMSEACEGITADRDGIAEKLRYIFLY